MFKNNLNQMLIEVFIGQMFRYNYSCLTKRKRYNYSCIYKEMWLKLLNKFYAIYLFAKSTSK